MPGPADTDVVQTNTGERMVTGASLEVVVNKWDRRRDGRDALSRSGDAAGTISGCWFAGVTHGHVPPIQQGLRGLLAFAPVWTAEPDAGQHRTSPSVVSAEVSYFQGGMPGPKFNFQCAKKKIAYVRAMRTIVFLLHD